MCQISGHMQTPGHTQTHHSKNLVVCQINGHMRTHGHIGTHDSKDISCVSNEWSHADTRTHTDTSLYKILLFVKSLVTCGHTAQWPGGP